MWKKRFTIICDTCGKFCRPYDSGTLFGTKSYEEPEPLDPFHTCKKCFKKVKNEWIKSFKNGNRQGDWEKSRAEIEAAKECGLRWVGQNGEGEYGTKSWKLYCYTEK